MVKFNTEKVRKYIDDKNKSMLNPLDKRKLRYSNNSFATSADINIQTFNSIMIKTVVPSLPNAYKIAKEMECKIEELLIITKFGD